MSILLTTQRMGMLFALALLAGCAPHPLPNSQVSAQPSIGFAWSNDTHGLETLRNQLQAGHVQCFPIVTDLGESSFAVRPKDFDQAGTMAVKIIQDNALTVELETDANGWGYEIWKSGGKIGETHF